jgi:hypothetical protein
MALLNFDASQVAPDTGFGEPIPDAWYIAMIDESEIKPTKDSATTGGAYLNLRFNILDGEYKGRKLFSRFNIRNANPTAQEIGYKQLSAVAHAVGVLMVQDSQLLHGIPLKVKVKIRPAQLDPVTKAVIYEANNEITTYKNINEATPGPVGVPGNGPGAPAGGFAGFGALAAPNPAAFGSPPPAAVAAPAGFAGFSAPAVAPVAAPAFAAPAPVAAPAFVPPAPAPAPAFVPPAPAPVFPPEGWLQHPQSAAHFYKGTEVLTEAELRGRMQPPAPAPAPAAPAFVAPPLAAPAAAPVAAAAQSLAPPWARPAA